MAKRNDTTVKVDVEAARVARIAASFKGMTLAEFVSWLILEHSPEIIAKGAADMATPRPGRKGPRSAE